MRGAPAPTTTCSPSSRASIPRRPDSGRCASSPIFAAFTISKPPCRTPVVSSGPTTSWTATVGRPPSIFHPGLQAIWYGKATATLCTAVRKHFISRSLPTEHPARWFANDLADLHKRDLEQPRELADTRGNVPHAHGAMMRGALLVPAFHKPARSHGEAIAAIRISNRQHRSCLGGSFRNQQPEAVLTVLNDGQQRNRAIAHGHLHRKAAAHLAVIDIKRPHARLALGNRNVPGSVMAHQHNVVFQIQRIVFGERTARREAIIIFMAM